jgi:endonuclease-3
MKDTFEIDELISILEKCYSDELCALKYSADYELLFAARLSAQCTDVRVNRITPELFDKFPTLEAFAQADVSQVENIIRSCGVFRNKARDIVAAANMLLNEFGGRVPDTMEDLLRLPGVGRKTANLMLGVIHNKPAIVVDTHCIRLSNRIGLVNTKDPVKIETALREMLPPEKSTNFCHRLVLHGRAVCNAHRPDCPNCQIAYLCKRVGV